jgi:hypothetical protein
VDVLDLPLDVYLVGLAERVDAEPDRRRATA